MADKPLVLTTCPRCGVEAVPRITPGTGPHALAAVCPHCGRWLRWLVEMVTRRYLTSTRWWQHTGGLGQGDGLR